tara:strand:- start:549 stop:791 length:243 start_codon:yes stop_codon:yes gene_type:complete
MSNFSYIESDSNESIQVSQTSKSNSIVESIPKNLEKKEKESGMFFKFCMIALVFLIFGNFFKKKKPSLKNLIFSPQPLIR